MSKYITISLLCMHVCPNCPRWFFCSVMYRVVQLTVQWLHNTCHKMSQTCNLIAPTLGARTKKRKDYYSFYAHCKCKGCNGRYIIHAASRKLWSNCKVIAALPGVDCDGSDRTELAALVSCIPLPENQAHFFYQLPLLALSLAVKTKGTNETLFKLGRRRWTKTQEWQFWRLTS
jgi:hypothetical protein